MVAETTGAGQPLTQMKSWYDIDGMEEAWRARKARLSGDKVFDEETKRIETALNELLNMYPAVFDRFFREFSELSVRLRSEELERFLEESPAGARRILQDYIAYARRFRVWFIRRQGSFRIMVTGPWQTKFRAQLVDGLFREIDPEPPGVEVFENERYVDDDLPVPTEQLEQLLASGKAKFVQLDDTRGKSALHQIEDIAYDPDSITFILHKSSRDYLFCLVGENVPVDSLWRDAGKAVNSLQLKLYGRKKAGRPRVLGKWKKATELRERQDGRNLKEKSFELIPNPKDKPATPANLASAQSFMSKARKKMKSKTFKARKKMKSKTLKYYRAHYVSLPNKSRFHCLTS